MRSIAKWLLGGFFIIAGILKALDPAAFQEDVLNYQLVGYPISFVTAYFLPFFEITLGIGVIFSVCTRACLVSIILLLCAFIGVLSFTWAQGIDINCGCFGAIDPVKGQPGAIFRDIVLIGLAFYLLKQTRSFDE